VATDAVESFMRNTGGLWELKKDRIPKMARKGGFIGVDGRFVKCDSEHLMLAGILQNGEACVMKYANILWRQQAKEAGIDFKQVNFVHDEWQVEVNSMEEAEILGKIQREAITQVGLDLGIKCPLAGTTDIGKNWAETH
jgi:DNA polymerase-1